MIISKDILGYLSVGIVFATNIPLIYLILIGKKKPHVIPRVIWALSFGAAAIAQYIDHGGAGSWSNFAGVFFACTIAIISARNSKAYLTRTDWITFGSALFAIPAWLLTHNPFYAALWATAIDASACVPLFRKAWHKPHEEAAYIFFFSTIRSALSMLAMENYSLTTMIYPVFVFVADFTFMFFLLWRRSASQKAEGKIR
jgi:hypothetical protein